MKYECIKYKTMEKCSSCDGYGRNEKVETDSCYMNKLEGTLVKFPCNRFVGDEQEGGE